MDASKQMSDYWHIPRASLAPSSASSSVSTSDRSNKSNSNPPTVAKRQAMHGRIVKTNPTAIHGNNQRAVAVAVAVAKNQKPTELNSNLGSASTALAVSKRGSRSSQGSSDSNHSTRSAASGSLLLTAANLERFAEIHRKQQQHQHQHNSKNGVQTNKAAGVAPGSNNNNNNTNLAMSVYNANLVHGAHLRDETVISIHGDPNLNFVKSKDLDAVSIASSMHFTMVNGEGGPAKKPKRGLCDRGRQVTVLIISMSTVFLLLIMGMVYALEMRAREMPQS